MSRKIDSTTFPQQLTKADFFEDSSGFVTKNFTVAKIGKYITGSFLVSKSTAISTTQEVCGIIKEPYQPNTTINSYGAYSSGEWNVDNGVAYVYISARGTSTAGSVFVRANDSNSKFVRILFGYFI